MSDSVVDLGMVASDSVVELDAIPSGSVVELGSITARYLVELEMMMVEKSSEYVEEENATLSVDFVRSNSVLLLDELNVT